MGIFVWSLATLPLEGIYKDDPVWFYALGWSVVLTAFVFIIVIGIFVMRKQDGYTVVDVSIVPFYIKYLMTLVLFQIFFTVIVK